MSETFLRTFIEKRKQRRVRDLSPSEQGSGYSQASCSGTAIDRTTWCLDLLVRNASSNYRDTDPKT